MSDDLQTVSPDQIAVAATPAQGAFVLIQSPGGAIQKTPYQQLLAKLIATDLIFADAATLAADLAHDEDVVVLVNNDPEPLNNGWWRKIGASGAGSWEQFEQLAKAVREAAVAAAASAELSAAEADANAAAINERVPANTSPDTSSYRAFKMGKRVVAEFNAAGEAILRPAAETLDRIFSGVLGRVSSTATTKAKAIAKYGKAWLLWGNEDGLLEFSQISPDTITYLKDALDVGSGGDSTQKVVDLINIYGQSNAVGSLSYSMTWRTPWPVFGEYPAGFSGTADGAALITTAQVGGNRTLSADRVGLAALAGNTVFGASSEGIGHGMLDSIVTKYPDRELVAAGRPWGGVPISYLDKPTTAEITAGATAEGVAIPTTSAEYLMQTAGQDMSHILSYDFSVCATYYYANMWTMAKCAALLAAEGKAAKITQAWLHGEANATDAAYMSKVNALYDQQKADFALITGQTEFTMLIQEPQYSALLEQSGQAGYDTWAANSYAASYEPGGANSAYTPEASRTNNYNDLNVRQTKIADEALGTTPARRIYNVGPTYPLTSLVHRHPHAARNEGENFGKVFCKVEVEGQDWKPLEPISYWYDATSIYIRFHVPKGGIQFLASPNAAPAKAGMPYGLEHSAGAIQSANIIGNDLLRITPDVAPATGQTLKYVATCRTGDLCDRDDTVPLYTDRAGAPNVLRNYCVPFNLTL